jgi:hypothetical protein
LLDSTYLTHPLPSVEVEFENNKQPLTQKN